MREEDTRRASDTEGDTAAVPEPSLFSLPDDPIAPATAPSSAAFSPAALPPELRTTAAPPPPVRTPAVAPAVRVRPRSRRSSVRPRRPEESLRRAARAARILEEDEAQPARHARPRRLARLGVVGALAAGAVLLLGSSAAVTAMMAAPPEAPEAAARVTAAPPGVEGLPVPQVEQAPVAVDLCALPEFVAALEAADDAGAIEVAGGGEAFRSAVAEGRAPCVDLADPSRLWVVLNKTRPADPIDYRPSALMLPDAVRNIEGGALRADAASALTAMVMAARDAGAGEIALESGFRSYETQQATYGRQVAARGAQADLVSARPGYSEHQSGLAGDVVPCAGGCGTLDDLALTAQGDWVAAHSWEHGWIVRYVDGATEVTGYLPEPWHLRYVGPELARAYHEGGWRSLEEFFGLGAAPDYIG